MPYGKSLRSSNGSIPRMKSRRHMSPCRTSRSSRLIMRVARRRSRALASMPRRIELIELGFAGSGAESNAPVGVLVVFSRLALGRRFAEEDFGFLSKPPEKFHQILARHRQLEGVTGVVGVPADVLQQPDVFDDSRLSSSALA